MAETTNDSNLVPCLPENAPFTPEQRAYLNGFLAGLFSRQPAGSPAPAGASGPPLVPLTILFGSQTGNAEGLAKRTAREAGKRGFAPTIHDMAGYPAARLASESRLLIVTSTFGDGEPPDNAKAFWEAIAGDGAPKLAQTRFSVCGIGDSNYPKFCGFARDLDARLEALGARRAYARTDCDLEFEEPFAKWMNAALASIAGPEPADKPAPPGGAIGTPASSPAGRGAFSEAAAPAVLRGTNAEGGEGPKYSRSNPFPGVLIANRKLNAPGSGKDTRHFEVGLDATLAYQVGDALGVIPCNCPGLVGELLAALKCSGEEAVPGRDGGEVPLREALLRHYEITKVPQPFFKALSERSANEQLKKLAGPGINGELKQFLWGREIIDLLLACPEVRFTPAEFIGLLKKLPPRLYSISSSPKMHPGQVHLTVSVVRYESHSRSRKGVCSTFLAERVELNSPVPVFVHANKNFRPPPGADTPMIMVGPGTGIAPFRAFLEERRATGARGRNWLFFGDQHSATDFMYRDELETLRRDGVLTQLDTAFSRDQAEKIYVQQRMREKAKELFAWLEDGAHFYVCGDANRMAKDVDAALHEVIQVGKSCAPEEAAAYVAKLKAEKRYQRDVY